MKPWESTYGNPEFRSAVARDPRKRGKPYVSPEHPPAGLNKATRKRRRAGERPPFSLLVVHEQRRERMRNVGQWITPGGQSLQFTPPTGFRTIQIVMYSGQGQSRREEDANFVREIDAFLKQMDIASFGWEWISEGVVVVFYNQYDMAKFKLWAPWTCE